MEATNAVLWIQDVLAGVKSDTENASFVLRYAGARVAEFHKSEGDGNFFHIEGKSMAIGGQIETTNQGWMVTRVDYFLPLVWLEKP